MVNINTTGGVGVADMERACPSSSASWHTVVIGDGLCISVHTQSTAELRGLTTVTSDLRTLLVQGSVNSGPEVSRVRTHTHARVYNVTMEKKKEKETVTQSFYARKWTGEPQKKISFKKMNGEPQKCRLKVTQTPASPSLFMWALLIGRRPPAAAPLRPTLRLSGHPYRSQAIKWQAARQGYRGCGNSRGGENTAVTVFTENYSNITLLVFSAGWSMNANRRGSTTNLQWSWNTVRNRSRAERRTGQI